MADLATNGCQQGIEPGYRFHPGSRGLLQLNPSHIREPEHDRAACLDTAAVINYQVGF